MKKLSKRKINEFKKICRFMGGVDHHDLGIFWMPYAIDNGRVVRHIKSQLDVMDAKFDSSFDHLMPVVEHIFNSSELAVKMKHGLERTELIDRVDAVTHQIYWWDLPSTYETVMEYIDWYLNKGYVTVESYDKK